MFARVPARRRCFGRGILLLASFLMPVPLGGLRPANAGESDVSIPAIQGNGPVSPLAGQTVTTSGVVVGDFQGRWGLGGFFLQDPEGDQQEETSDGIFVCTADQPVSLKLGDRVQVRGRVSEVASLTSLVGTADAAMEIRVLGRAAVPLPVAVRLPVAAAEDWERWEGMRITIPQELVVSGNHALGRYGELLLSAGGRLLAPTDAVIPTDDPSVSASASLPRGLAAVRSLEQQNRLARIVLDDGSLRRDPPRVPYIDRSPGAAATIRCGSVVRGLTGVVDERFGAYRIQPTEAPAFDYAKRPQLPKWKASSDLTVAAWNLLNYFVTIDDGTNDARGADSEAEFQRQKVKVLATLATIDADIVGLIEVENHPRAVADLVAGLNERLGDGGYQSVPDPPGWTHAPGGNEPIRVALLYKPSRVALVGKPATSADAAFRQGRAPLAQGFRATAGGPVFVVAVSHFKSKRPTDAVGPDLDQGDGQGAYNRTRREQAAALGHLVAEVQQATDAAGALIAGDLNAHAQEEPIQVLRAAGFHDLLLRESGMHEHSYVHSGEAGSLDHAFASPGLRPLVVDADVWQINADEPAALSYDDSVSDSSSYPDAINGDSTLYQPDPYRSSDHDPVIVGLKFP